LKDSPCHELPQPHEGVWGEGGGVFVVQGCWGVDGPVLEEHVPSAGSEGLVGLSHEFLGGMFVLGGSGACRTRGRHVRPPCWGRVRCARASIGRCFLIGGEGIFVRQPRGRYTEERPFVRCLDESWALKEEREGNDCWSLAEAGLAFGGAYGIPMAARRLLYLQ